MARTFMGARDPEVQELMRYLRPNPNLPERQRDIAEEFHRLAELMLSILSDTRELAAGLRKLLEAKDCFVRTSLPAV